VKSEFDAIEDFDDWYVRREVDYRDNSLVSRGLTPAATTLTAQFEVYKREHSKRVENYWKYETMADAEVVSRKADLPNVSSGEIAGMVRRTARNVVQHTPNVEIICEFDDDSPNGILARHILTSKIIGEELNSNEMQQNLFASVMSAYTLGFDAVTPVLMQQADGAWCMEYDTLHYRDVFPEPGVKDARKSPEFFVRRYLTKGEIKLLIRQQPVGWDIPALITLAKGSPPSRQQESVAHQDKKHHTIPDGYELITWYSRSGDPFLTFEATTKMLVRIEKNKDPLKRVPVQLLVLEKDSQQPLGKSQISLVFGRQEFQDLMLNGAMKLWYRNINPTLIGYGTGLNGVPNMSPGKYTNIPNPNAKIEAFEVSTQTLLQYGQISEQNQGAMVNLVGAADQQMAAAAGNGMSATPQGVEAQQSMVDITTNNYQKAVEFFFSKYCSYALTVFFQEMKTETKIKPSADARQALVSAGIPVEMFDADGFLTGIDLKEMATVYNVRCVPGSLVEMEDEKQMRVLNQLFVTLGQSMGAIAQTQNQELIAQSSAAIQYIVAKQIELSGSKHAGEISKLFSGTPSEEQVKADIEKAARLEAGIGAMVTQLAESSAGQGEMMTQIQSQLTDQAEINRLLLEKLGVTRAPSGSNGATPATSSPQLAVVPTQ
jgi:hypothetical protein